MAHNPNVDKTTAPPKGEFDVPISELHSLVKELAIIAMKLKKYKALQPDVAVNNVINSQAEVHNLITRALRQYEPENY